MAAILQLRQGSTSTYISQGPNIAEPFFDTGSNILVVGKSGTEVIKLTKLDESNDGSFSITGDITASNAILSGDITIGGNIILGDDVTDDITISGQLDSNLIPKTDATYDLGSTTKKWNTLHVVSGSIDSIDLSSSLPSGVISGSGQLLSSFDNYGNWRVRSDGGSNINVFANYVVDIQGGNGITTTQNDSGTLIEINVTLDTGSSHFSDAVSEVGAPAGTISGSQQVIELLPTNIISGSEQLPSGLISGSSQLPDGVVSGSTQITDGSTILSGSIINQLPSGVVSGSTQITDGSTILSGSIVDQLPSGIVSGSSQISELTHLHSFTSSYNTAISLNGDDVTIIGDLTVQGTQTQLNTANLNIEDKNLLIASGAASSAQADGAGITVDGANRSLQWKHGESQFVFDAQVSSSVGFKGDGSNLTGVTADEIEYTNILNKPTLVSGSEQILGGTNIVSSSTQVINLLPTDTISGSSQITDGSNIVSSSDQVLGATNIVSSSTQVINFLPTDTISGSEQLNSDLDLRYPTIGGSNLLSSSDENFTAYSQSVDLRLEDTLDSGSSTSQSLHTLVGNFPTSGSLGTSAFYNVSSSLADDPNVIPNVKAVYDYINNTIGAADITGVSASLGLSGGGDGGYVSMSLDTGSTHFVNAVQGISPSLPSGVISGSGQLLSNFDNYINWRVRADNGSNRNVTTNYVVDIQGGNGITTSQTDTSGLTEINVTLDTGSSHFSDAVSEVGAPAGTISGSSQITSTDLDMGGNKVLFGNVYSTLGDLPSAATYHGMFAHVHATGKGYFAHAGNWVRLLDETSSGLISGSAITTDGTDLVAIGTSTSNVGDLASGNQLSLYGTSISGLTSFDISGTAKSFDYVASDVRYIDTNAGVSIALKPDADGAKSWVVDTDGDLVSNGGGWASGNAYMNNLIASSSVTASNMIITNDVIISGDLNVAGTTTYTSTNNVNIGDNIIELNFGGSATEGGILVKDATNTTTSGSLLWDSLTDSWTAGALGSESDIVTTANFNSTRPSIATFNTISGSNIHSTGTITAEGDIVAYASSDERLKDEIIPISNPIEKINSIGGYSFVWNNEKQNIYKGKDYGVIAQEIENILPELVDNRKDGYKAVKYDRLVSLLIEGIKELSSEVKELKEKINKE